MTKTIHTLIDDIYSTVQRRDGWFDDELARSFSTSVSTAIKAQFTERKKKPALMLSKMGNQCPCALWHSVNRPDLAIPAEPWANIKFTYGHMLEALLIALARASGHEVTGEQDAVHVDGIRGRRDCIIDGCLVDVKSASTRSFQKIRSGSLKDDDPFGYLSQLDGYLVGSMDDPLLRIKDRAYIFAIDKTLGHLCLYEHRLREASIRDRVKDYKRIVSGDSSPACCCGTVPEGKSGNIRLDTRASYSAFKFCCFPNLRTFIYSSGPVFLTEVVRLPDVIEISREGKIVPKKDYVDSYGNKV